VPGGVLAEGLVKRFGSFTALDGVDFRVAEGTVVGLLGPNGAGKTTTIRILTTLLQPDGGRAEVAGYDVVTQPHLVRATIGLTGQYAAVDEELTGRENLVLVGRLCRLAKNRAKERADRMLTAFSLADAGDRLLRTYSGGMRRRLDLAGSLMVSPPVLFLDEPTTGLDPRSRLELWDVIEELRDQGTTIVLTTQYLEEADQLAQSISVIDGGNIIAEGTADELKARVGGDVLDLTLCDRHRLDTAADLIARTFGLARDDLVVDPDLGRIQTPVSTGAVALTEAVRALDAVGLELADLTLRRPSLDDVFLKLTGHAAEQRMV
jgi:ABC-2 type transport system ATP-binding protein